MIFYPYRKIFLQNISHNFQTIQKHVAPAKLMAVIKSDGYGHNMVKIAQLLDKKADYFFVDRLQDALILKEEKITTPIFLGSLFPQEIPICAKKNIEFVLGDWEALKFLEQNTDIAVKIHLKVDSGMSRLGFEISEYEQVLQKLLLLPKVQIKGVWSHLAVSEQKEQLLNQQQIEKFRWVIQKTKEYQLNNILFHLANSGAIINFPESHFNMVRTGLLLYGVYHAGCSHNLHLKPALELVSGVLSIKKIQADSGVSYSHTWKAKESGNLALIALGYGDGVLRNLSNNAKVLMMGKKHPIVGNICMGIAAVFLGQDSGKVGQEVLLLGIQDQEQICVEDLALQAGSISHEILTSLGKVKNFIFT